MTFSRLVRRHGPRAARLCGNEALIWAEMGDNWEPPRVGAADSQMLGDCLFQFLPALLDHHHCCRDLGKSWPLLAGSTVDYSTEYHSNTGSGG